MHKTQMIMLKTLLEELNLTYPNEEFISFKKDKKNNENEE